MAKQNTGQKQGQAQKQEAEREQIRRRMDQIKEKIIVLSGKGGVGKSTVAANLAVSLSASGKNVGLLDIDIHGPSIPDIFNLKDQKIMSQNGNLIPVRLSPTLVAISIGLLLRNQDDPVIWRGPMKYQMIKQFLQKVEWGRLDYLIIDSPPGTGDEPLSVIQLIENPDGAVVVTTPQQVALSDVRKGIAFCRSLELPVIGVIENMSGFSCPECGHTTDIFKSGGGEKLARDMGIPFLGKIPIDPKIVEACESGQPYVDKYKDSSVVKSFNEAVSSMLAGEVKSV